MIFATVGTHEDPFDRLLRALDELVLAGALTEPVVIQSGYATYTPRACTAEAMIPFDRLQELMAEARIVVTHGGPASIMQAFAHGKVPVVVPRQSAFGEHVDDHQVRFARKMADRVLVVEDIADLGPTLRDYDARVAALGPVSLGAERAATFAARFDALCHEVLARPARPAIRRWLAAAAGRPAW